jgi:non-specific serine/threonine protein kinase
MRGLHYLVTLLREPGREFYSIDLVRGGRGPSFVPPIDETLEIVQELGNANERLDARARAAYRMRLAALDEEIADAERACDLGRLERASPERDALIDELRAAARDKRVGPDAERARVTATKGIKAALDRIAASHPELGAHLHATVRRGYFCSYVPDPRHPIKWGT